MDVNLALDSFRYDNDEHWFQLILKCTKLPSVNSMYGINTGTGAVYKDAHTYQFETELKQQLAYCDPLSHCDWIEPSIPYGWHMNFLFGQSFWSRDASNMVKSPEDVIFRALGLNDARVVEGHIFKSYYYGKCERLIVKVFESKFDFSYFSK